MPEKNIFELLYEEVLFEFADRFGRDAVHAWYLSLDCDPSEDAVREFLKKQFPENASDDDVNFLLNHINAQDCLQLSCEYLAMALGLTLERFIERGRRGNAALLSITEGKDA